MALVTAFSFLIGWGLIPAPYDPGFSSASDEATAVSQPCPPSDAVTVAINTITVNVYNGTDTAGLASGTATVLTDSGATVASTADWPRGAYTGNVMITASQAGLANAYSLAQAFTGIVVVSIDENTEPTDPTVSVVLGEEYEQTVLSAAEIAQFQPGQPIAAPAGCEPGAPAPDQPDSGEGGSDS